MKEIDEYGSKYFFIMILYNVDVSIYYVLEKFVPNKSKSDLKLKFYKNNNLKNLCHLILWYYAEDAYTILIHD